jgi:hypothetical protein
MTMLRWISGAWAMLWNRGAPARPAEAKEGSPAPPAAGTPSAEELYGVVREGLRDPGSGRCWWGEWESSANPFHARYQAAFEELRDFISARASAASRGRDGAVRAAVRRNMQAACFSDALVSRTEGDVADAVAAALAPPPDAPVVIGVLGDEDEMAKIMAAFLGTPGDRWRSLLPHARAARAYLEARRRCSRGDTLTCLPDAG